MTAQLLFYQDVHPVSADRHKDVSIKSGTSYKFAKEVNSVPVTAIEFAQAAAEYPIVFAGTDDTVTPAVVLGAQQTQNLFVGDDGAWLGKYVPAFVRRYPFVFSTDRSGRTFILHIDESFDGFNREGRGERLFDSEGQQTQYLKSVLGFLQDYQARHQRTRQYCERLKSLGLLQPMQAQFNLNSGERRSLSGFMTVNREKLKALASEDLQAMFTNDELECTYLHLHSLRHFSSMLERMPEAVDAAGKGDAPPAVPKQPKNYRNGQDAPVEEASA
ncbi:SapC family protein [Ensifer sp. Root278]|uniref:SapC family protein n=1 Tax=Ensifer sp. Root278 TaxID=1736509 RepID=UPI00070A41F2|nr:SapC family protein [Ensifer sp. Root278]KRD66033.1 multidrug transporter [Ensifer sp. Root278]